MTVETSAEAPVHAKGALAGLRVLDLTRVVAGPLCAQTLADLGADVIKVERRGSGEDLRGQGPPWLPDNAGEPTGEATYFQSVNRGKRSIQLDIAQPGGAAILRALAGKADVFLENFRTGTLARYGLGYADLSALNPGLIYCSITGFGQTGPYSDQSGYDMLVQAMGGMMEATGLPDDVPGGGPMRVAIPLADYASGQNAAISIMAALRHRDATGRGQHIDIALFDSQFAMLLNHTVAWLNGGQQIRRSGNDHPTAVPYGVFTASDGHILIATFNDREFVRLAAALGHPEWPDDPRFVRSRDRVAHRRDVEDAVNGAIAHMTRTEAIAALHGARISAGPINAIRDLEHDPQLLARDMIVSFTRPDGRTVRLVGSPLKMSETPGRPSRPPPLPGQHTSEVLREWAGFDDEAIEAARRQDLI